MNRRERIEAMNRQRKHANLAEGTNSVLEEEKQKRKRKMLQEQLENESRRRRQRYIFLIIAAAAVVFLIVFAVKSCTSKGGPSAAGTVQKSQTAAESETVAESTKQESTSEAETCEMSQTQEASVHETVSAGTELQVTQPEIPVTTAPAQPEIPVTTEPTQPAAVDVNVPADPAVMVTDPSGIIIPSWITVDLLHVNEISRPAIPLVQVNDIAIHYVGNAGSTAKDNRDYFDSLDNPKVEGAGRKASAHFVVGLNGEIEQCLPLNEIAYAVHEPRNYDTISIEVCHPDDTGKFSDITYQSVIKLTAWLLQREGLDPSHVIRHHDCDGKSCPKYYVEHEDAWIQLKQDIADYYYTHPDIS